MCFDKHCHVQLRILWEGEFVAKCLKCHVDWSIKRLKGSGHGTRARTHTHSHTHTHTTVFITFRQKTRNLYYITSFTQTYKTTVYIGDEK